MSNIDINKFPHLAKFIKPEEEIKVKKQIKRDRTKKTNQGVALSERLTKLFGDPAYYFSFLGVQNKKTAATYLASLRRTKRHTMDRIKLIELLEMIESGNINLIKETLKTSRLMAKLQDNKDIRDHFLNGKLSVQELENLFDSKNN